VKTLILSLVAFCGLSSSITPAERQPSALERLDRAVVVLRVLQEDGTALGSGVVIGEKGGKQLVLTVAHILAASDEPGRAKNSPIGACDSEDGDLVVLGELAAVDRKHDLALIRLLRPLGTVPTPVADREPALFADLWQLGGVRAAPHVAGRAILASKGRGQRGIEGKYYQIVGSCWPGMSGSPVADADGRVVGIMRALYVNEDEEAFTQLCFAVPLPAIKAFLAGRVR
jgi:S1-C subfamily serine protease